MYSNDNEMTETEILVRINKLQQQHEILKKELIEYIDVIEVKKKELISIEQEYVELMQKMTS